MKSKSQIRVAACLAAIFLCVFLPISSLAEAPASEPLPVCANVAGVYLQTGRAQPGVRLLSSYLNSFSTFTARPYTSVSRSKLYIYLTIVSTSYAGRAAFNPLYVEATQVAPYVFTDIYGQTYTFELDEQGRAARLLTGGEEWRVSDGLISPFSINMTILLLQLLCLYALLALAFTVFYALRNRRRHWKSLSATRLNTLLTCTLAAALFNNAVLLIWAVPALEYARLAPFLLLNAVFLAALPLLCVAIAVRARKSELDTRQKTVYTLNILCALVCFALLALWGLYR